MTETPKPSLLTSIEELSDGIFNQPIADRAIKEQEAANRIAEGRKAAPSGPVSAPPPEPPPIAPPPGVKPDEKHDDDLVIDGLKVEQPDEIKSDKGKKSWKMYKETVSKKISEYEKRIKDMESKVSTGPNPEQYETKLADIQKERDDLTERLGRANIQLTPEFERHYIKREKQVIEDVQAAMGKDHSDRAAAVLLMPEGAVRNGQLNDMMENLDQLQKQELSFAVKELRQINKDKKEQIDNWKEGLTKREEILKSQQEAGIQQYSKIFDSTIESLRKEQPLFGPKDGDAEWTDRAQKMSDAAREFYMGKGTPQERAKASLYATFSGVLLETLRSQGEEMGKLTKQLEALRGKQPSIAGGTEKSTPVVNPNGKPESMVERMSRLAKESGFVK